MAKWVSMLHNCHVARALTVTETCEEHGLSEYLFWGGWLAQIWSSPLLERWDDAGKKGSYGAMVNKICKKKSWDRNLIQQSLEVVKTSLDRKENVHTHTHIHKKCVYLYSLNENLFESVNLDLQKRNLPILFGQVLLWPQKNESTINSPLVQLESVGLLLL